MEYKVSRLIYRILMCPFRLFKSFKQKYIYFIFPNIRFIFLKKLECKKYPICQQRLYLTGQGNVSIGTRCSFGYEQGGFNKFGSIEIQTRFKNSIILSFPGAVVSGKCRRITFLALYTPN